MSGYAVTSHAVNRMEERLADLGFDPQRVFQAALRFQQRGDYAVRVATLPSLVGTPWSERSNGDTVWPSCAAGKR